MSVNTINVSETLSLEMYTSKNLSNPFLIDSGHFLPLQLWLCFEWQIGLKFLGNVKRVENAFLAFDWLVERVFILFQRDSAFAPYFGRRLHALPGAFFATTLEQICHR